MLLHSDIITLQKRGISNKQVEEQLNRFITGFPFLEIRESAAINHGIIRIPDEEIQRYLDIWDNHLKTNSDVLKFVPASGAATRMFKDLYEFIESDNNVPTTGFENKFFGNIEEFAFYNELNESCIRNEGKNIRELTDEGRFKDIASNLLDSGGLNYGSLPKGLLKFHSYSGGNRTPMQEHLMEGILYARSAGGVNIHFTVSGEHRILFEKHLNESLPEFEQQNDVTFNVTFSEQKPSTDTIAVDIYNRPFRENDELLFRPGGHGALIQNLNDLDTDIIFIKNIDNVVPDSLKSTTVTYKKLIAGILIGLRKQIFNFLRELESNSVTEDRLAAIAQFCESELSISHPNIESLRQNELKHYLFAKLNRPIRVCGMVKNEGEPGGGPFLTVNSDGTVSPQILESSQINLNNPNEKTKMMNSTHFNPVDLVCGVKNYQGGKFNLLNYVDENTGFISLKSRNGRELKALELPGLWNGAMSNWNTVFVEVPIETFNPVKTVNDLLRKEHR